MSDNQIVLCVLIAALALALLWLWLVSHPRVVKADPWMERHIQSSTPPRNRK